MRFQVRSNIFMFYMNSIIYDHITIKKADFKYLSTRHKEVMHRIVQVFTKIKYLDKVRSD